MIDFKLTVKNYRCFDDSNPLIVEIGSDFTALVGPNNSGKSSFLKFFVEHRVLWGALANGLEQFLRTPQATQASINAVSDPLEIFSNSNNRDIFIDLELQSARHQTAPHPAISRLTCTCSRSSPHMWQYRYFRSNDGAAIAPAPLFQWIEKDRFIRNNTTGDVYDARFLIDTLQALATTLYIGPFRNAVGDAAGAHYDLQIGTSFISLWDGWKTGGSKLQNRAVNAVVEDIRTIFGFDQLEISASHDKRSLVIKANNDPYRVEELGAGLSQFIVVLGNAATKRPRLILIDEPELHLHPSLQIDFLTSLASYARDGIIFATHSIGLARSTANRIYSFQKINGCSSVRAFQQTANYAEFVGELSFSSFRELGFERILLVEGVSDVKVFQQFLRNIKKDHRVVILPLGGTQLINGDVEPELAELTRISNQISALVDSERTSKDEDPPKARLDFEKSCKKLGIAVCLTSRRAVENYFSDAAIKKVFGDSFSTLGDYGSLKGAQNGWRKSDNWKIAKEMSPSEISETDVGRFLHAL
jgi:energy-coupling factor transporter ATP-binding protein EcfA2